MKKVFLSLITIFMVLSLSIVLVKAEGETISIDLIDGVQIRTDENAGLKWVAKLENPNADYEYGFLFAQGEVANLDVETLNVEKYVVEGVTAESTTIAATMTKFPKAAVAKDITVRAYFKNENDEYTYSNVVVRNLAEVAVYAKNSVDGDFVNSVIDYVGKNYKKLHQDTNGHLHIDNSLYETSGIKLGKLFISDWNTTLNTTLDPNTAFVTVSYSSPFRTSARNSSQDSPEGSNLYKFFSDKVMFEKWGWILSYIENQLSAGTGFGYVEKQIECLKTGQSNTGNWYYGDHLISYLLSIFNEKGTSTGVGQFKFELAANQSKLASIVTYNNTVYSDLLDTILCEVGQSVVLPKQEPVNGYTSTWKSGENTYNDESLFNVENSNAYLQSVYVPNTYNIKYYYGTKELVEIVPATYTIESETIILPEYQLDGYKFIGWFDNPELKGDPIVNIEKGSTEDINLYAKLEESSNVANNVTLNLNGAELSNSDFIKLSKEPSDALNLDIYSNNPASYNGINILSDSAVKSWSGLVGFYKIVLNYEPNVKAYKVVLLDSATISVKNISVAWSHVIWSSNNILDKVELGNYIVIDDNENLTLGDTNISSNVYTSTYEKQLIEETELPAVSKEGYVFKGWLSSVDGAVVLAYPGYKEVINNITYSAQFEAAQAYNVTKGVGYVSLATAIKEAASGDTVKVYPGVYSDVIDLTKAINLITPNSNINPVNDSTNFLNENAVIIKNVLSFNGLLDNCTISGFTFTESARVFFYGPNENAHDITGFKFTNNYCYNTSYSPAAWNVSSSTGYTNNTSSRIGFMNLGGSYRFFNNSEISYNVFKNINDSAIQIQYAQSLTLKGNSFEDIAYDAVRLMDSYGTTNIDNNNFKNVKYAALFFRTYCPNYRSNSIWNVTNNTFENVATYSGTPTSDFVVGAICSRGYGEIYSASWHINFNKFINTPHSINLRDNVTDSATWAEGTKVWECEVKYNAFINSVTPVKYQENWKLGADSAKTNTGNFLFDYNYYGTSTETAIEITNTQFTQILSSSHGNNFSSYTAYEEAVKAKKTE